MLDFTVELAKSVNALPFEIFKQDKDEVIMLINYYIEKGGEEPSESKPKSHKNDNKSNNRIRVNDKTASGGWF